MWYAMVTLLVIFALFGHLIYENNSKAFKFEFYLRSRILRFNQPIIRIQGIKAQKK